jgi:hypothetical protein
MITIFKCIAEESGGTCQVRNRIQSRSRPDGCCRTVAS